MRRLHRLGWGWAPLVSARLERPERGERMLFSRLHNGRRSRRAAAAADGVGRSDGAAGERLDQLTGPVPNRARASGRWPQRSTAVFAPKRAEARPTCCSPRPAPGSARPSPISRRRRCGPRRSGGDGLGVDLHQGAAAPVRCRRAAAVRRPGRAGAARSSFARAARIICACSTSRMRCRARSPGARRSSRSWSGAGRPIRKDGDMVGGDLPGWLPSLFRRAGATALTDRRGECVYAGCPHYRRCFIERAERAGREADIVIANHALVMVNAARGPRETRRRESCSTRAIICSTPPIRPSRWRSAGRKRSSSGAGSSAPRDARAGGGAGLRRG